MEENEYIQFVLDSQKNILLLTDGHHLKMANRAMLDFFGHTTFEDFVKAHNCICDMFVQEEGYLSKEINGKLWIQALIHDENTPNLAKIKDLKGRTHIFQIDVNEKEQDGNLYSITFTDITDIEAYKKVLKDKIKKIKEKQQILIQNSKMASMGEMIANIAHQWRQPLNSLSALHTVLMMDYEESGTLTVDQITEFKEESCCYIHQMSNTIDDFRNFFSPNKEKESFVISEAIRESVKFVKDSYRDSKIELIDQTQTHETSITSYRNELMQVIMILLNNSRDAIVCKKVLNPQVIINLTEEENNITITVQDNGGGIDENIIDKVFEPYFTTKFQSDGTGVGLYMSKMIIEDSMGGKLILDNFEDGVLASIVLES
ncbi:MAG TPA: HAMP domain-containing histidine kinase [Campylobacterales bacterium]|nr:HAMP domain-containing histidine kinase [Campylobacterales bacterium]